MQKKNNGRLNLVVSVVLVISVMFLFIALGTSDIVLSNIRLNAYEHYRLLANNTAETINAWLAAKKEIIENQRAALEITGVFDTDHLTNYLSRAVLGRKDLNEICDLYFVDPDNTLSTANGFYTDPGDDLREREWYTACLETRDLFFSSPYLDASTGSYVMTISVPVHDKSGSFKGVLALDIYVDAFSEMIGHAAVPEKSYIFLIDNKFGIASHPNDMYGYINNLPQNMASIPGDIYSGLEETIQHGDYEMLLLRDYDGVMRDMFSSNIECCSWSVVAAISDDVLHNSERTMAFYIIGALFISLSIGIIFTLAATSRIMKQLSVAMDEANAANETKSSFLANMSHEIRTPINAVIGMNEMIQREDISDSVREYSLDIAAASRSLIGIINDVLDFSKIESGKLEIVEDEFSIASMVSDIVSMSVSRLGDKPLELLVGVDPEIPAGLIGDEMRLKQIIINLITNGIKYTDEGYVSLNISCAQRDYGINLDISVRDSGIGITPQNLEKLFTSFQQINTKRNRSVEGTGLGLAITKRLVERMGGFVNVESEYGVGSEFRVSIPLKVSKPEPFISAPHEKKYGVVCLFSFNDRNMAAIDEQIRLLVDMTGKMNTTIRITSEITEAEALIEQQQSDMLFIDRFNFIQYEKRIMNLADKISVVIVQDRMNAIRPDTRIKSLYKPVYCASYAALINNEQTKIVSDDSVDDSSGFTAPGAKVLIVDDNAINLKVAAGLMKPYKMKIHTADSGMRALEILEQNKDFTVVFMDHMMPQMDGIETTALIRAKEDRYYKELPIIALTANTVNDARSMFLSSGFDDFLAKPIDTGLLDRLLRKFIPENLRIRAGIKPEPKPKANNEPEKPRRSVRKNVNAQKDFDPEAGIKYTGGDKELYIEVLTEYVKDSVQMRKALIMNSRDKKWKDYIIKVHALKSTSLNMGASPLSEAAKKLELAGKAGEYETIIDGNDELIGMYDSVLEKASAFLSENGVSVQIHIAVEEEVRPSDNESADEALDEKAEISRDNALDLIKRFLSACEEYNREEALLTAHEAAGFRCGDIDIGERFDRAAGLCDDFEYDEAAKLITDLREEVGDDE